MLDGLFDYKISEMESKLPEVYLERELANKLDLQVQRVFALVSIDGLQCRLLIAVQRP